LDPIDEAYLLPTNIIDSDHEAVVSFTADTVKGAGPNPVDKAVKLYYAARDCIRYDPYHPCYLPEHFRASNVLRRGGGFCVCKATLLCAMGRAAKIPTRLRFADVRNHVAHPRIIEVMHSDVFVYHGITEFFLEGKWVKSTPAFDSDYCRRFNTTPLEFNGREDSIFQAYNPDKGQFMEYVADHGVYSDVPVDAIMAAQKKYYGEDFIKRWIRLGEKGASM